MSVDDRDRHLERVSAPPPRIRHTSYDEKLFEPGGPGHLEHVSVAGELTQKSLRALLEKRRPTLEHNSLPRPSLPRSSANRASLELARRSEYPLKCSVNLSLQDSSTGERVYYKYDGQRFSHADATIKLTRGTSYDVVLSVKPEIDIVPSTLHIHSTMPDGAVHQNLIFLDKSKDRRKLHGSWKCDLEISKKSDRVEITVEAQLAKFGHFSVPLLAKVYDATQKHARQGFKLSLVVFELLREDGVETGVVELDSVRYMS